MYREVVQQSCMKAFMDEQAEAKLFEITEGPNRRLGSFAQMYQVKTDENGIGKVIFDRPHDGVPGVFPVIVGGDTNQSVRVVDTGVMGFTVHVFKRDITKLLGKYILSATTTDVAGAIVVVWVA